MHPTSKPLEKLRPPSLTHSRASSSDSAVSSSSSSLLDDKPLPALPSLSAPTAAGRSTDPFSILKLNPGVARPASIAILEQINEVPSLFIPAGAEDDDGVSAANSMMAAIAAEDACAAQTYMPYLDLAVPASASSPSLASTLTPKRPESNFSTLSPSSRVSWTPRSSHCFSPSSTSGDSDEDAFELENSLARQEAAFATGTQLPNPSLYSLSSFLKDSDVAAEVEEPLQERSEPEDVQADGCRVDRDIDLEQMHTPEPGSSKRLSDAEIERDQSRRPSTSSFATLHPSSTASEGNKACEVAQDVPSQDSSPCLANESPEQSFVAPLSGEPPALPLYSPRRQSIKRAHFAGKLSFGSGGWRGWRTGSQPCTPVEEAPPSVMSLTSASAALRQPLDAAPSSLSTQSTSSSALDGSSFDANPGIQVLSPKAGTISKPLESNEMDYFASALSARLLNSRSNSSNGNTLSHISEGNSDTASLNLPSNGWQQQDLSAGHVLPKLSPEFTFGRRTPSPAPSALQLGPAIVLQGEAEESVQQQQHQQAVRQDSEEAQAQGGLMTSSSAVQLPTLKKLSLGASRRARAASADQLRGRNVPMTGYNGTPMTSPTLSTSASTSKPTSPLTLGPSHAAISMQSMQSRHQHQHQHQRGLHRMRLSMRRHGASGPRMQARSFDADALKKLKESGGPVPKYDWI